MSELEATGLVEQPHTSAGRVPTDQGYRFYVDHMLGATRLSKGDLDAINSQLWNSKDSADRASDWLMEKTSHLLSAISKNVGIVISPSFADNILYHVEFVRLSDDRILAVLVSAPSLVHHKVIRVDDAFSQEELERTSRYLNAEFTGKSLRQIRAEILKLMKEEKALYDRLLQNAVLLFNKSVEDGEEASGEVYVDGASNILASPDFPDTERMRELFRTFEEKSRLVKILNECVAREHSAPGEVQVLIGRENRVPSMQDCSLITAAYRIGRGEAVGALGVVGPMRIEYARMVAVVNYVARLIERISRDEAAAT